MMKFLKNVFYVDLRSLALFRIGLALVLLSDLLLIRGPWFEALFSDAGIFPRSYLLEITNKLNFSIHLAHGSSQYGLILFALQILFGVGLLLGYRTKLCTFMSWFLLLSLHNRNLLINSSDDDYLRILLLISFFLPTNAVYSLDRGLTNSEHKSYKHSSLASAALMLQIVVLYFSNILKKDHAIWHTDYTAIYYALQLDAFTTDFGQWLSSFSQSSLQLLTNLTYKLEFYGPFLIFVSFRSGLLRLLPIVLFCGFHFGLFLSFYLGIFPWLAMVAWLSLLPSPFWDWIQGRLLETKNRGTLYYDPDCGFCRRSVLILKEILLLSSIQVKMAPEDGPIRQTMKDRHSWVLQLNKNKELTTHYDVFLELLKHSPLGRWMHGFFALKAMRSIGNSVYLFISRRRRSSANYLFNFRHPTPPRFVMLRKESVLLIFGMILSGLWIYDENFNDSDDAKMPEWAQNLTHVFRIEQQWNMFAPFPTTDDGWVVSEGELASGEVIDVLRNTPVSYERPKSVALSYEGPKWRKLWLQLWSKRHSPKRRGVVNYICNNWNKKNPDRPLQKLTLFFMSEETPEPGGTAIVEKKQMWTTNCN